MGVVFGGDVVSLSFPGSSREVLEYSGLPTGANRLRAGLPTLGHLRLGQRPPSSFLLVLRPLTFFAYLGFTNRTSMPLSSRIWHAGIQYTPVDSMTTLLIPQSISHSAIRFKSAVNVSKRRTGSESFSSPTSTQISLAPISMPPASFRSCCSPS